MSDVAREVSTGNIMTAAGFRSLYFSNGTEYSKFECPTCGVEYGGKNLYKEDFVKRPHFALKSKCPHLHGCNGDDQSKDRPHIKRLLGKYKFLPRNVWFPEELTDVQIIKTRPGPMARPISESDVAKRRSSELKSLSAGAYRYPSVRAFGETWNAIMSSCLDFAGKNNLNKDERASLCREVLSAIPLALPENKNTDYYKGIISTRFPAYGHCIYRGTGTVTEESDRYIIKSEEKTSLLNPSREIYSTINVIKPMTADLDNSQTETLSHLAELAVSGKPCKWFAYGIMIQYENGKTTCELKVEKLNWLFIQDMNRIQVKSQ